MTSEIIKILKGESSDSDFKQSLDLTCNLVV